MSDRSLTSNMGESLAKPYYLSGRHGFLGPCSEPEVVRLIEKGQVDSLCLIWSPEHEKWTAITSFEVFDKAFFARIEKINNAVSPEPEVTTEWSNVDEFWRHLRTQNVFRSEELSFLNDGEFNKANNIPVVENPTSLPYRRHKVSTAFAIGILVSMSVVWFLGQNSGTGVGSIVVPGLSKQESLELAAAANAPRETVGVSGAIGVIQAASQEPSFVIASNQAEGSRFKLSFEGVPESLVNAFQYSGQAVLTLKGGLSYSQPITGSYGQALPRGEYKIKLTCESCADRAVLAEKSYFLGGTRDAAYDLSLREYHEQLRQQARSELMEARQLVATLEQEFADLRAHFSELRASASLQKWNQFYSQWQSLHKQMGEMIQNRTRASEKGQIFYSDIFSGISQSHELIEKTSRLQREFAEKIPLKAVELNLQSQIEQEGKRAQDWLTYLQGQITKMEQLPLSANGMPRNR